jgi:hypothetical protein
VHYKKLYDDKDFLFSYDLDGRDVTVTIEKCIGGEIIGEQGRKNKVPVLFFVGKKKRLGLNRTNGKTIAAMYGTDVVNWAGKSITLFPTTTQFGGETKECIRIRPVVPQAPQQRGKGKPQEAPVEQSDEAGEANEVLPGDAEANA